MSTGMQLERSEVKMSGYYNNWSVSDMDKYVKVPLSDEDARSLKSGDYVYLTGTIYTARDAAHKRMQEALDRGEALPIGMKNNVIYYMGPSPAREGRPIGSAGPTTASRMDKYAPGLLDLGLKGMIGKGKRSQEVRDGKQILQQLQQNMDIAGKDMIPICQDTGMAVVFLEVGQDVHLTGGNVEDAVNEGVRQGYVDGYLRKSVVKDPIYRENTKDNTPAIIQ